MENPLQQYYRHKEIYVKLPTGGRWLDPKPNLNEQGEIGIRPMSMKDELLLNIPDALFNGQAMFELIQSICPDIQNAYDVSLPDVDVILLASRASSYDKKYPVEVKCPHCETLSIYDIDLQQVLGQIQTVGNLTEIEIDDLVIEMRPNTLAAVNANNIKTSELARILVDLKSNEDGGPNKEKQEKYSENMAQIAGANIVLIADSIVKVTMPDGVEVTDKQSIVDWISNSNRKVSDALQKQQLKMNLNGLPDSFDFTCSNEDCKKAFSSPIDFNPSFFFTNSLLIQQQQAKLTSLSKSTKTEPKKSENN